MFLVLDFSLNVFGFYPYNDTANNTILLFYSNIDSVRHSLLVLNVTALFGRQIQFLVQTRKLFFVYEKHKHGITDLLNASK